MSGREPRFNEGKNLNEMARNRNKTANSYIVRIVL